MFRRLIAGLALLALAGCAPSAPTVPVTGTVRYDGKPVESASVVFLDQKVDGKSATGQTDSNGNFTLDTPLGGNKVAKGAIPGDYVVTVSRAPGYQAPGANAGDPNSDKPPAGAMATPEKAQEMMKSGQKGGANPAAFMPMANAAPPSSGLPAKYSDAAQSDLKAAVKKGEKNHFEFELKD